MDYLLTVVARDVTELQQVLASLAARGGQRLVTYLRLEEIKPPSRLPLLRPLPRPRRSPAGRACAAKRLGGQAVRKMRRARKLAG